MQCKCFSIITLLRSCESFSFWRVVYSLGNLYQEHISQAIEIHLDPDATGPITMREISFLFTHFVFISKQMNTDKFLVSAYFSMSEIFAFKIENHSHTIYFAVKGELTSRVFKSSHSKESLALVWLPGDNLKSLDILPDRSIFACLGSWVVWDSLWYQCDLTWISAFLHLETRSCVSVWPFRGAGDHR